MLRDNLLLAGVWLQGVKAVLCPPVLQKLIVGSAGPNPWGHPWGHH